MAEHSIQSLTGRPRCLFIGGVGRLEFELENGQIAQVACDVLPKPEPPVVESASVEEVEATELPPVEEAEKPKPPRGKLPAHFPGLKALNEAGIETWGQLRKERDSHDQSLAHIPGIAEATDLKIQEALEDGPPSEEEETGETEKE